MIHDLTNLEPLLHQYDHEKILVGPLLNLWTNSSFRVFNIAGKSSKIHETVGLGFFEVEIDAQRRRADIVAALQGCFAAVESFDSQLEMAQMAHTLWANDETTRFLATVSWESKLRLTRETSQNQNLSERNKVTALSDDQNNESGDEEACTAVAPPDATDISEPPHLGNLSDIETFANVGTIAESVSNLEIVRNLPAAAASSSASKTYRLWALSAAYFALCFVVGFLIGTALTSFTSMRQTANEARFSRNAAASITADNDPSEATGTVTHPVSVSLAAASNDEGQSREAVRVTSPSLLTSQAVVADGETDKQPSQNRSVQAEAAPDEQLTRPPKAQSNQSDDSISLPQQDNQSDDSISRPQSSPPQMARTQSSAAETVPVSITQPPEVVPTQSAVPPASTQIMASHDGPQLLPSDAATPKGPEASSTAPQQRASNLAIVPLPRSRPAVGAVSSDRPRRRVGPSGEGARNPLLSLFGH